MVPIVADRAVPGRGAALISFSESYIAALVVRQMVVRLPGLTSAARGTHS